MKQMFSIYIFFVGQTKRETKGQWSALFKTTNTTVSNGSHDPILFKGSLVKLHWSECRGTTLLTTLALSPRRKANKHSGKTLFHPMQKNTSTWCKKRNILEGVSFFLCFFLPKEGAISYLLLHHPVDMTKNLIPPGFLIDPFWPNIISSWEVADVAKIAWTTFLH